MMATGSYARIILATADRDGTFARLRAGGAEAAQEPITEQPYGVRDCAFRVRDLSSVIERVNALKPLGTESFIKEQDPAITGSCSCFWPCLRPRSPSTRTNITPTLAVTRKLAACEEVDLAKGTGQGRLPSHQPAQSVAILYTAFPRSAAATLSTGS